ncbi:MAG TPA: hypothetical protein VIH35_00340 [Kiritimatiellia bacterium]|jgi:hypothetical protein
MSNSRSGQSTILMTSVILNVVLIGIIFWLGVHNARILMNTYVKAASERAEIRKSVLVVLESNDSDDIAALKQRLKLEIDVDQRVAYKLGAPKPPAP